MLTKWGGGEQKSRVKVVPQAACWGKKSTMLANKQCCFGEGLQGAQMKSSGERGGVGWGGDVEQGLKLDTSVIRSTKWRERGKLGG